MKYQQILTVIHLTHLQSSGVSLIFNIWFPISFPSVVTQPGSSAISRGSQWRMKSTEWRALGVAATVAVAQNWTALLLKKIKNKELHCSYHSGKNGVKRPVLWRIPFYQNSFSLHRGLWMNKAKFTFQIGINTSSALKVVCVWCTKHRLNPSEKPTPTFPVNAFRYVCSVCDTTQIQRTIAWNYSLAIK